MFATLTAPALRRLSTDCQRRVVLGTSRSGTSRPLKARLAYLAMEDLDPMAQREDLGIFGLDASGSRDDGIREAHKPWNLHLEPKFPPGARLTMLAGRAGSRREFGPLDENVIYLSV
jgi:hypothetical protein